MTALTVMHDVGRAISVRDGDVELFEYVYVPDSPQLESPKPYLHPLRTRAGRVVSLFRPHDHVWHKGIAWSLPVVNDENFWGGPTYVHGQFYVQLPNDGTQAHRGIRTLEATPNGIIFAHELEWITEAGETLFTEVRTLTVRLISDEAWALGFETALTNVANEEIAIGSPTTKGRENAGYGGLFWRGPRSFSDGTLVAPGVSGAGNDVRGQRFPWMGFAGKHDDQDATSLVLMVDDARNPQHPPQWFARSEEYAVLNPAPFFSEEHIVPVGATAVFRYGVGIADSDETDAPSLAAAVTSSLGVAAEVGSATR